MNHIYNILLGASYGGHIPLVSTGRIYEFYKYVQTNWTNNKQQRRLARRNRNINKRRAH